jgi:uncharacterized membrane protein
MESYAVFIMIDIVFIFFGFLFVQFPPKKINSFYGYRTKNSMKNQENWDFAHRYSGKMMTTLFLILLMGTNTLLILKISLESTWLIMWMTIHFLAVILVLFKTESQLKKLSNSKN